MLQIVGDLLLCACVNGSMVRFSFESSILPHLPDSTNYYILGGERFVDMILWNRYLISASRNGIIYKCNTVSI